VTLNNSTTPTTVATTAPNNLPAGDYKFDAKTTIDQTDASGGQAAPGSTVCTLNAAGNTDSAETAIGRGDAWEVDRATLNATVTATLPAATAVTYVCQRNGTNFPANEARQTRIIAIKVDTVTRTPLTP
jgi:hypothetical protein